MDPHEWSRIYDLPSGPGKNFVFRRTVELALELCEPLVRPGALWLDAGCGTGHLLRALQHKGAHVIGADRDLRMLDYTSQRSVAFSPPLVAARAEALPFQDTSVDGVVATSLMGCLPSPAKFFAEANRVLRADGHAVLTFTNKTSWLLKLNHSCAGFASQGSHYHLYRASDVSRDLKSVGFDIDHLKFYNFVLDAGGLLVPPAPLARRAEVFGGCLVSAWLARNFIVIARKAN